MQPVAYARMQGFTLIELMIVVLIIGILAAIALPNYRQYLIRNAEEQAKNEMMSIANQLSSWRSKRLSYRGFMPINMCGSSLTLSNCYSDTASTQVYIPIGSDGTNYKYLITLVDASPSATGGVSNSATDYSRTTGNSLTSASAIGNGWRMKAEPNLSNGLVNGSATYYYDSTGQRCSYQKAVANTLDLTTTTVSCTGTGIGLW